MKIILSASPSLFFFTKSSEYQIWEVNTYYILTNGNRTWTAMSEPSTRISMFHDPTDSEQKFHKTRIENWLSIGFEPGTPWLRIYSHNHYIMHGLLLISWMRSLKLLSIYQYSKSWKNPGDLSLPLNCTSAFKIHTQCPELHQTRTKPNHAICLIIYKSNSRKKKWVLGHLLGRWG